MPANTRRQTCAAGWRKTTGNLDIVVARWPQKEDRRRASLVIYVPRHPQMGTSTDDRKKSLRTTDYEWVRGSQFWEGVFSFSMA